MAFTQSCGINIRYRLHSALRILRRKFLPKTMVIHRRLDRAIPLRVHVFRDKRPIPAHIEPKHRHAIGS